MWIHALVPEDLRTSRSQAILDSRVLQELHPRSEGMEELEMMSRDYIYIFTLHPKRAET